MAKRRMQSKRVCLRGGYMYRYEGKRNWQRSSQERWEIIMHGKAVCGQGVGSRIVDGARVVVVKQGGRFYAAGPLYTFKPGGKR